MFGNQKQNTMAQGFLNEVSVASPCNANWSDMVGDERSRFCNACEKNVYNLSALTPLEAQQLVAEKEGKLCIRFYQREDGTMLTQDCPKGIQAIRIKVVKKSAAIAAAVLTFMLFPLTGKSFAIDNTVKMGEMQANPTSQNQPAVMGDIAIPPKQTKETLGTPVMGKIMPPSTKKPCDTKKPCCKKKKCKVHKNTDNK